MDYIVVSDYDDLTFVDKMNQAVALGYSPIGSLHESRAGNYVIALQLLVEVNTTAVAMVQELDDMALALSCSALAGEGYRAFGEVLVKDGTYLIQLMIRQVITLPASSITGITPFGESLISQPDAATARALLGAGTSSLELGTVAGTAKEGNYQPVAGDIGDATPTGIGLIKALNATAARTVIGAGTSNLEIGITAGTAKEGDYQPTVAEVSDATPLGRQFMQVLDTAQAKALVPYTNEIYRASFTTAGASIQQNCVTNNVKQAITYNSEAVANADLGTMNLGTGVFTCAAAFDCVFSIAVQMQRGSGILGAAVWLVQLESSIDNGATWQPAIGSTRRVTLPAGDNNLLRVVDYTLSISTAVGLQLRVTQASDNVATNIGLFASAAGNGMTTSAGIVVSLYTVK